MGKIITEGTIEPPPNPEGKSEDQLLREKIPSRADLPTQYHPETNLLMVLPLKEIDKIGAIYLPNSARIQLNEGHIVEAGPLADPRYRVSDCVTWNEQSEYRMEVDGVKFVLVSSDAIIMRIPREELGWKDEDQSPSGN